LWCFHRLRGASRRRPGLTPIIDVVFLLLVFFMLASRFGQYRALPLSAGAAQRSVLVRPGWSISGQRTCD
jgi:Biopolymer transport protein